jgi:hypothetical protein
MYLLAEQHRHSPHIGGAVQVDGGLVPLWMAILDSGWIPSAGDAPTGDTTAAMASTVARTTCTIPMPLLIM